MTFPAVFQGTALAFIVLLGVFVWRTQTRSTLMGFIAIAAAWMLLTDGLARAGLLGTFDFPPRIILLFIPGTVGTMMLARRSIASAAPWSWLIGLQTFRVVVELLIHGAVERGIAPPQLTWTGLNFDIVTGVTAPIVAWLVVQGKIGRRGIWVWNLMGMALLLLVVSVAVLSMPIPIQRFHPDNTWVVGAPYIWLPCVFVFAALWLHVLSFRKLLDPGDDKRT